MSRARSLAQLAGLILLSSGLLLGCGSKVTQENYAKIQSGMTQAEVKAILGEPTESSSIALGPVGGTTSTWKGSGGTITIQFMNDKVIAKLMTANKT
ncbi:MAG TPA: outer membrane protein assembly factor BamE [Candidatus Methylomirabilis sp.]|nr:outer membrane protein assembly factor BamE [Candidatus Methylomirabilis sp.]